MIINRVSIIIGDKNSLYSVINKTVGIIRDTYSDGFSISDLTSFDSFSIEEKEDLRNIFSHDITKLIAWEHIFEFYFYENIWKYKQSTDYYRIITREILLLLNTSTTSIGETVCTNDYRLIESLYRGSINLYDDDQEGVQGKSRLYEVNFDAIEFISRNLKTRVGDSCEFNLEFVKAFIEAQSDYYLKLFYEAALRGDYLTMIKKVVLLERLRV
jgi:hypothetical protein